MTIHAFHGGRCGCDRAAAVEPGLLTLSDALECLAHVEAVSGIDVVPLDQAVGRCLAEPVAAKANTPPFHNSAVDGYAVALRDLKGTVPWSVPIAARIAAGDPLETLTRGTAARIFTGAPLPVGADAVVMQEDVIIENDRVLIRNVLRAGENVRPCGEDMAQGDVVLPAGRRMCRRDIGLAAAAGANELVLRRPVRVALLVTGSEIVDAGQRRTSGQINDVNGPMLQAAMAGPMVEIVARASLPDRLEDLGAAMVALAQSADLVVTTGGVSVGEEDYLHRAFAAAGGYIRFAGVAMKPGKPISFGHFGANAHWLGLPGNPTAAYVGWHVLGRALIAALQGQTSGPRRTIVRSAGDMTHKPGRCELRPASFEGFDAEGRALVGAASATQSGRVRPLAEADGLLVIPAESERMPKGALFEFLPFDDQ